MRIEMPVNHHAHPHRETSVKLTVIIQYKTVCVLVTKPTFTKANLLLHRYILPLSQQKRTVNIDQTIAT